MSEDYFGAHTRIDNIQLQRHDAVPYRVASDAETLGKPPSGGGGLAIDSLLVRM